MYTGIDIYELLIKALENGDLLYNNSLASTANAENDFISTKTNFKAFDTFPVIPTPTLNETSDVNEENV